MNSICRKPNKNTRLRRLEEEGKLSPPHPPPPPPKSCLSGCEGGLTCKGVILAEGVNSRRRDTRSIASGLVRARKTCKYIRILVSNRHLQQAKENERQKSLEKHNLPY